MENEKCHLEINFKCRALFCNIERKKCNALDEHSKIVRATREEKLKYQKRENKK